jgi:hypothetical protein
VFYVGAPPRTPPKTFLEKGFWISKNFMSMEMQDFERIALIGYQ